MRKMTFEEFNEKAHQILGDDYIFYPPYDGMKKPIKYKHLVCNTSDTLIPDNIFREGAGCKYCSKKRRAKKRRINEKEFKQRLHKVRPSDDIVLLEPLHGLFKKTKAKCLVCDYGSDGEWTPLPINLLKGKGCPNCAGNAPKTPAGLVKEVENLGKGEYKLLGTKRTNKDGIWLHLLHKVCNKDYWVRDYSFMEGYRCRFCANKANGIRCRITLPELKERIKQVADGQYRYVSGVYENNQSIIYVKHLVCEKVFDTTWAQLRANKGLCPRCGSSSGEQIIMNYLDKHGINYIYGYLIPDLKDQNSLHFDFWLQQFNIAIEYDGQQHFKPVGYFGGQVNFDRQKKHDKMKDAYCEEHEVNLIRIRFDENVNDKLDQYLLPLVKKEHKGKINFKQVDSSELTELMTKYHYLHRRVTTSYCYALYYDNDLAGMVTYTKPRISLAHTISDNATKDNTLELSRLYIKDYVSQNIPNITSKFVGWTLRQLKQVGNWYIISFADSGMHHIGAIYQATNFLYCGMTKRGNYAWNGYGKHGGHWEKGKYYRYKIISSKKYRYIKFIGSKSFKKHARKGLKFKVESYPKADSEHYKVGDEEERLIRDRETGKVYTETELAEKLGMID